MDKPYEVVYWLTQIAYEQGKSVEFKYTDSVENRIEEIDVVVWMEGKPGIAVKAVEGGLDTEKLKGAVAKVLEASLKRNVGYYIVRYDSGVILLNMAQMRKFAEHGAAETSELEQVIERLKKELFEAPTAEPTKEEAKEFIESVLDRCGGLINEKTNKIRSVEIESVREDEDGVSFFIDDEAECDIILALLNDDRIDGGESEEMKRYTSLDSFLRIVNEERISLCSVVGMNDRSECNYAAKYIYGDGRDMDETEELDESDHHFIMSFVDASKEDDLTMWRLYGDDGRGVCLSFNMGKSDGGKISGIDAVFAKVSYGTRNEGHPELDFIKGLLNGETSKKHKLKLHHIDIWKHFFKPYEYTDENEKRLLVKGDSNNEDKIGKLKWIKAYGSDIICRLISLNFKKKETKLPIELESVILGPKCPESDINVVQLKRYIESKNLNRSPKFEVKKSTIKTYR